MAQVIYVILNEARVLEFFENISSLFKQKLSWDVSDTCYKTYIIKYLSSMSGWYMPNVYGVSLFNEECVYCLM